MNFQISIVDLTYHRQNLLPNYFYKILRIFIRDELIAASEYLKHEFFSNSLKQIILLIDITALKENLFVFRVDFGFCCKKQTHVIAYVRFHVAATYFNLYYNSGCVWGTARSYEFAARFELIATCRFAALGTLKKAPEVWRSATICSDLQLQICANSYPSTNLQLQQMFAGFLQTRIVSANSLYFQRFAVPQTNQQILYYSDRMVQLLLLLLSLLSLTLFENAPNEINR